MLCNREQKTHTIEKNQLESAVKTLSDGEYMQPAVLNKIETSNE